MFRPLKFWLRAAFRRAAVEQEMTDEMRAHLDRATERHVARGLSVAEARLAARREFGNVGVLQEQGRDARGAAWVESVRSDLRYGARSLRASPAFAIVAILSLAIGIGANTAIFTLINAVMLRSLPVDQPATLLQVSLRDSMPASPEGLGNVFVTNPIWEALRDASGPFASYAVSSDVTFDLASGGEVRPAYSMWVNGDYFHALGVRAELGRVFDASDDVRGCPARVVVSHAFWKSELGGAKNVIGRTLQLSGVPYTLIGVAREGFFGVDVGKNVLLYTPLCSEPLVHAFGSALDQRSNWWLRVLARPKPGVSPVQFAARLKALSRGVLEATVPPRYDAKSRAQYLSQVMGVLPGRNGVNDPEAVRSRYSRALLTLMAMVGLILMISCANVANLLLARGAARGREMAIRLAIGASRGRLVRQFLTESLLLAALGSALGLLVARWAGGFLVRMFGGSGDGWALDLSLDLRVLAFTGIVAVATVVLFGLTPAWRATRVDPQIAMKAGGRGNIEGHSRFRIGKSLVVAQSALALVLVVVAGLLVGSFRHLTTLDPGFRSEGVLITTMNFRRTGIAPEQLSSVKARLLDQLRAVPGVRAASQIDITPMNGSSWNDFVAVDGVTGLSERDHMVYFNEVSDGYFGTMHTRMIAGRDFGRQDGPGSTPVAIVNQAVSKRFFGDGSPIGRTYHTEDMGKRGVSVTIIGLVENSKYRTLREDPRPVIYLPFSQDLDRQPFARYVLSVDGPTLSVAEPVKSIVKNIDPRTSVSFTELSEQISKSLSAERVLALLSGAFAGVALILAMIGLYGVMAYTVARRRVEIGIRIALGAARGRVIRLVMGDVGLLVGLGILLGSIATLAGTRFLGSFLYGVTARDPITIVAAASLLTAAALVAGAIPARRAARLEPVEALRED